MTCPKCGNVLNEGNMYCEVCGEEMHIVPEFIPEIELSIEESLSSIAKEVNPDTESEVQLDKIESELSDDENLEDYEDFDVLESFSFSKKISIGYIIAIGALIFLLIGFVGITIYHDNSAKYQIGQADKYYTSGNYKKAIEYYKKAVDLDPDEIDYRIKYADCYLAMENIESAIDVFKDMIIHKPDSTLAFAQIISLYEQNNQYDEIDDFLQHYANDTIRAEYNEYLALEPTFNYEEGTYDEEIELTLTNNTSGLIYYTIDNEDINQSSPIFTEPISISKGQHVIRAFFENEYGVCSSVTEKTYDITISGPDIPLVSLNSGEYNIPQLITVDAPSDVSVYYTVDGSDPTSSSLIYGEPIPLQIGISNYKFVAISNTGELSDIVEREYTLNLETAFSEEDGLNYLYQYLVNKGYIKDVSGASDSFPGVFSYLYSDLRYISGISIYCYNEYYVYGTAARATTGIIFGIDVTSGNVYLVTHDGNDNYTIKPY